MPTNVSKNLLNLSHYYKDRRNPDILDCIANLSSDEVFTPPELADKVLDLLPEEVWSNPNLKWLDPACKTGVFLRQIAIRLMVGLKDAIPDEAERREHIFKKMLYGMPITRLTALMSRRSVYYAKNAMSDKSVVKFNDNEGNIIFVPMEHHFKMGKCTFCGLSQNEKVLGSRDGMGELENHAYQFIHLKEETLKTMKFDVIVGNPPYQLGDGGGGIGSAAMPIYQLFVRQAKKLHPKYIAFITPSRWFVGGRGLDDFRDEMLADRHIKELVDYPDSSDCFPGVDIVGGVSYFIMDTSYSGKCKYTIIRDDEIVSVAERFLDDGNAGILIRYPEMISILQKVKAKDEKTFDSIVSSQKPYGLRTDFFKDPKKYGFPDVYVDKNEVSGAAIKVHGLDKNKRCVRYVPLGFPFISGRDWINKWKIFMPSTYGCPAIGEAENTSVLGSMIIGEPLSACTETFCSIGNWNSEKEVNNAAQYIKSKFFRLLVGIKKTTQRATKDTYSLVPLLDFNKSWTDEELYKRYDLSEDEISFIEKMIKEME